MRLVKAPSKKTNRALMEITAAFSQPLDLEPEEYVFLFGHSSSTPRKGSLSSQSELDEPIVFESDRKITMSVMVKCNTRW